MSISAIGLSGLTAADTRLAATASNVANVDTTGPVPPATGTTGNQVYAPIDVQDQALPSGGTAARLAPGLNNYIQQYAPDSPDANGQGLIAAPNIDLTAAVVSQVADAAYAKANIAVLKVSDQIQQDVLNLIA